MAQKFILASGMPLLVETMPHLRSIASGIWVNCGSVYEHPAINGVSHFLEHMLFKGTPRRWSSRRQSGWCAPPYRS